MIKTTCNKKGKEKTMVTALNLLKKYLNRIFIDGLSGMALGLFSTLIVGTIIKQIGTLIGGNVGGILVTIGMMASVLTGAGIGCGVAYKFKEAPLVVISAATTGMVGAFASSILAGGFVLDGTKPGEPLGAFVAAYIGIEIGHLIAGKTKIDIILTPIICILTGSMVGLFVSPTISNLMTQLGVLIEWGTIQQPLLMGIVVSVIMGMVLTLPISSAALGIALGMSGISAGAATVGCCVNMIGFAVASYRENKIGGLLAQGLGTSMLQVPNIVKKPIIWLPVILTSAILGPVSTCMLQMTNNKVGAGMGTAGLVGQITTYQDMVSNRGVFPTILMILLMHFILPAVITLGISEFMRKRGWIKSGDMKLEA